MPSIISTIGYITEANTTTSTNSPDIIITKGIIACNRPEKNDPLFISFVAFNNSKDKKNNEIQSIDPNLVYLLHGKFVYNTIKKFNGESNEELQVNDFNHLQNFFIPYQIKIKNNINSLCFKLNVLSAYRVKMNVNDTPEQEVFISFQCSVLSIAVIDGENISFKSQAVEYSGKIRTVIPITCVCSVQDKRMLNKINKLQQGNKIEIVGNLIKNEAEIVVTVTYLVYINTNDFSTSGKKDLNKVPWLESSAKNTREDQSKDSSHSLPSFILNQQEKTPEVEEISAESSAESAEDETISLSDNVKGKKK